MRYLFIHPVFPGQCHKLIEALAAIPGNEVVHLSERSAMHDIAGVKKLRYKVAGKSGTPPHPYLVEFGQALVNGDAVVAALLPLRARGWRPDVIVSYAGHGQNFYLKDIFPEVPLLGYFEWYVHAFGGEYNFEPDHPLDFERQRFIRVHNVPMLMDLQACDGGITPTRWQHSRFPKEYHGKIEVIHDGVDTGFYSPLDMPVLKLGNRTLHSRDVELVTYCTRGMEPFRGFPEFMRALCMLQQRRPNLHAVIVGTEEFYYSRKPEGHPSYKAALLQELSESLDIERVHFTGWLQPSEYRDVLRASRVHVYLTYPYVLSWSLIEALSTGCMVLASRTAPVMEVIRDGENGLLVDFPGHDELVRRLEEVLDAPELFTGLRRNARRTALENYDRRLLLPRQMAWLQQYLE